MPSPKPLFELFKLVFRDNDALRRFLAGYDYVNADDLVDELPGVDVPRSRYAWAAADHVQAHGLDDAALFAALVAMAPRHAATIEAAARDYLAGGTSAEGEPDAAHASGAAARDGEATWPVGAETGALSAAEGLALGGAFEKVMEERPTFLDVWFLAVGLERARSVAKLRMRLHGAWYSGTAFLIAPDALLTAHHNLWEQGTRADAVEVIFDYERAPGRRAGDGPEPEGRALHVDPSRFAGDADADWAIIRLPARERDRPLAPLADHPPRAGDRVSIIQHPLGWPKQVALHHNLVTHADGAVIQYFTDTHQGSSGSPVFDERWDVVAIHHRGGLLPLPGTERTVMCNQGVAVTAIRPRLAALGIAV